MKHHPTTIFLTICLPISNHNYQINTQDQYIPVKEQMISRYTKFARLLLNHTPKSTFLQTKLTEQKLKQLKIEYKVTPTFDPFRNYITTTSDYFKVFQLVERQQFSEQAYQELRALTGKIQSQSDNVYLLRAKVSARIAENYAKLGKNKQADAMYNEALEIFEQSLVPQVLQYYSIYRKYGMFLQSIDENQKARQILSESVEIMRQYVRMSQDAVTANYHSIQQARACVKLIYLDPKQREKWLKLANEYWKQCEKGVYDQIEYAQTVYENSLDKAKVNAKKARLYAEVEMQKIPNEKYHQIILKAFGEDKV